MWFFTYDDDYDNNTVSLPYFTEEIARTCQRELDHAGMTVNEAFFVPDSHVVGIICRSTDKE